jgi:VWFA-related protein
MRLFAPFAARRVCMVAACAWTVIALRAQTPEWVPEISLSAHLVQISVVVRDGKGPVAGLSRNDFAVFDQGKPRKISVFAVESDGAPRGQASVLPKNTFSDRAENGRNAAGAVTIILLDNLNTLIGSTPTPYEDTPSYVEDHALSNAKQHLLKALRQMDLRDRIAVYGLRSELRMICDFTCDRDQLLAAVTAYDPTSKTQREAVEPGAIHLPGVDPGFNQAIDASNSRLAGERNQDRSAATMRSLRAIASHVANIPGRKNLLWLTANLPFSGEAVARILAPANISAYPVDARGLLGWSMMAYTEEGALTVKPLEQPTGIEAMEEMADDTGGHAYVNRNDLTEAIQEVVEGTEARYTLGFYLEEAAVDGKFHPLKVQVKRAGMTARYPKGYFALKDASGPSARRGGTLMAALRSPFGVSAIPLEVKMERVDQPKPHMLQVMASVGIEGVGMKQDGAVKKGTLDVLVVEQNMAGDVLHQATHRMALALTDEQYQAYLQSGVEFRAYLQPQENTTVVRVLVRDAATLQMGSVVIPLAQVN